VVSFNGDTVVIEAPSKPHTAICSTDNGFLVGWSTNEMNFEVSVEMVEITKGGAPLWTARAISPFERRELVRAQLGGTALLYVEHAVAPIRAEITDLSSSGMGCLIPTGIVRSRVGSIEVSIDIDGTTELLRAEIAWWGPETAGSRRVGLKFKRDGDFSHRLRNFGVAASH